MRRLEQARFGQARSVFSAHVLVINGTKPFVPCLPQVGTMFATQSHPGKTPEGVGMLNDVRRQLQVEGLDVVLVLGVGGIDASNCGDVVAAGGDGVAAIRCLCSSSDAEGQARRIVQDMRNSAGSRFAGSLGDEIK